MKQQLRGKQVIKGDEGYGVNGVVHRDLKDIKEVDLLLVRFVGCSVGTSMELVYARLWNKPIVAFVEGERDQSPWLPYHATVIVDTLDEAVDWITEMY
jgi:hypothetical protein